MGRYYNGDIGGKFWFAVQSSTAADRFGKKHYAPSEVEYYYEVEDLPKVEAEIKKIKDTIGEDTLKRIDDFFKEARSYNDDIMEKAGISTELWNKHKSDYADLGLGIQIRDHLQGGQDCSFTAEL